MRIIKEDVIHILTHVKTYNKAKNHDIEYLNVYKKETKFEDFTIVDASIASNFTWWILIHWHWIQEGVIDTIDVKFELEQY